MARVARIVLGWGFLLLGVAGLFLPVLQGVLFLAIGLAILAPEQAWAGRLLAWLHRKFPASARIFERARHQARGWRQRFSQRRPRHMPRTPGKPEP